MVLKLPDPFEGWDPEPGVGYQVVTFWPDKYKCKFCGYRFDMGDFYEWFEDGSLAHQAFSDSGDRSCNYRFDLETGEATALKRAISDD